jgi:hypothetical protein
MAARNWCLRDRSVAERSDTHHSEFFGEREQLVPMWGKQLRFSR